MLSRTILARQVRSHFVLDLALREARKQAWTVHSIAGQEELLHQDSGTAEDVPQEKKEARRAYESSWWLMASDDSDGVKVSGGE